MKRLPFFKFDVTAWLTGNIQLLTMEEQGIFINLCALIWRDGGKYKVNKLLHRKLNISQQTLNECLQVLEDAELVLNTDGYLSVKFIDEQIKTRDEYVQQKREAGKKSAEKRAAGNTRSTKQKAESISRKQKADKKTPPKKPPQGDLFEECWAAFNKYGNKQKAKQYWAKLTAEDRESIKARIPVYMQAVAAGRTQKQFEGWINPKNREWETTFENIVTAEAPPSFQQPPSFVSKTTPEEIAAADAENRKEAEALREKHAAAIQQEVEGLL